MRGFKVLSELVGLTGTECVFSMLGSTNATWIGHGVADGTFRLVRTRHEETAVQAATGYSRVTGSLGICSVTRGPGFTNSITALAAAADGHIPVVLIVGESPATSERSAQNIAQRGLAAVLGVGFHHASRPAELEAAFWAAVRAARFNGIPQVLSVGDGVLEGDVAGPSVAPETRSEFTEPDADGIGAAVDLLARARRPLILAGQGAVLADCRTELEELAGLSGARVGSTLMANRYFSGHPQDLGLCGGWAAPITRQHIADSDVVLAVGASLNTFTLDQGRAFGTTKFIQCEVDAWRTLARSPEVALVGDARLSVSALIAEWHRRGLQPRPAPRRPPTRAEVKRSLLTIDLGHDPQRGLDFRRVYHTFDQKLPEDRVVVTDLGRTLGALPSMVDATGARNWLASRSFGSIGLGLGTAVGAAAACPDRPVVLFCGDGGFMLSMASLDAVRINALNLTVVILNDEQYGSELMFLEPYGLPTQIVRQELPDIATLAEAFGGRGLTVRSEPELEAIEPSQSGLLLIDARIDPGVDGTTVFHRPPAAGRETKA